MTESNPTKKSALPSLKWLILLGLLGLFAGVFLRNLSGDAGYDVSKNRKIPVFALASPLKSSEFLTNEDIIKAAPALVNIWASWCAPCRAEHPKLTELAMQGVRIFGINYKDKKENAQKFIAEHGNPFVKIGGDETARVGIDWGIRGVPETFVIGKNGRILYRHIGVVDDKAAEKILGLLKEEGFVPNQKTK